MRPDPLERFSDERGQDLLLNAIAEQKIVLGNRDVAQELCARGTLKTFEEGEFLTHQDDWSNSIVFIVAGKVRVLVEGFKVALRAEGQHVGEMALIDPSKPRSASVEAMEPTVGLVVSESDFSSVAQLHPEMWRYLARETADRLRQRKRFIRPPNETPVLFIACAAESLDVAAAIKNQLESDCLVVEVWTDGVFKPSLGNMESLERKLEIVDFAVAIFSADDKVESRGAEQFAPRDNTVFELGLFAGAIGRDRSFFAVQKGADVKVPSDLAGITSLRFESAPSSSEEPLVESACSQIKERVSALGTR